MANSTDPDLDLHCLQRQGISGLSRTRVNQSTNGTGGRLSLNVGWKNGPERGFQAFI